MNTKTKKVAFVAHDQAPTTAFKIMEKALLGVNERHNDLEYLTRSRYGRDPESAKQSIKEVVLGSDIVVVGLSSSKELSKDELEAAALAKAQGAKVIFFSDTYGLYRRSWISTYLKNSTLTVIDEEDAKEAQKLHPTTEVVVAGNPVWDDYFNPKSDAAKIRENLYVKNKLILYAGGKNKMVNIHQLNCIIDGLIYYTSNCCDGWINEESFTLVFTVRPDEEDPRDLKAYTDIKKYSPIQMEIVLTKKHYDALGCKPVIPGEIFNRLSERTYTTTEILPASDLFINLASGVGIQAAHLRIPVIDFFSVTGYVRHEEGMGKNFTYPPAERGATCLVRGDTRELGEKIIALTCGTSVQELMKSKQKLCYPKLDSPTPYMDRILTLF